MSGLYNIVSFDDDAKWFVLYEGKVDKKDYSYLAKLNDKEDGITKDFKLVKSEYSLGDEYMEEVTDQSELKKVLPKLIPEVQTYIDNPDKIKDLLASN